MYRVLKSAIAITKISDLCFKECIDVKYKLYTTEEDSCVERCVKNYFQGYQDLAFHTNRALYEE
jgi:hypothetical protein